MMGYRYVSSQFSSSVSLLLKILVLSGLTAAVLTLGSRLLDRVLDGDRSFVKMRRMARLLGSRS